MPIRSHAEFRPPPVILAFVLAVTPCHGHGGYHEEIQATEALIATDPDNATHWFHRGELNLLHGDWMRSLADLQTVERLAPGKYPVDLVRGQAWMAGEKLSKAEKSLGAFITSHPEVAEGFATRARLMMKLGRPTAAVSDLQKSLAKTPSPEPDLYVELADALIAANHPEDAVKELDAGISRLGKIPSLAGKALELELSLGFHDAALSRVEILQQSAPRPEPWMAKRASILAQAGRLQDSQTAWNELREHLLALPDHERDSHSMSMLLEQACDALEALSHIKPNLPP